METAAEIKRNEEIDRVDEAADGEWKQRARNALADAIEANIGGYITTDDIVCDSPREPRAWGPIMTEAAKGGLIENTKTTRESTDVKCNARPKTVWKVKYED